MARSAVAVGALALLGVAPPALAGDGPAPRLVLTPSSLSFSGPGDAQTITLRNEGDDVLRLGPLSLVSSEARGSSDFMVPALSTTELEPGASETITITYRPPANAVPAQAFAALLITADDAELPQDMDLRTGAPIARRLAGVPLRAGQTHTLAWMILLPLLGAALVAFAPARRSRALALAAAAVPLVLGAWVIARFDPTFSIADGNGGLQLMARATLVRALGFQYFVGVDGVSLLFVLLAPVIGAIAVTVAVTGRGPDANQAAPRAALAAVLLVQAGATGVFVSQDGLLLAIFWAVAAAGLALLAGRQGRGAAVAALASAALLLLAMVALHVHSRPSLLVDGTPVAHGFDVARLAFSTSGAASLVPTATWGVLLVALAVALPLFPFATPAAALGAAPLGLLWSGLFSEMALYGLARLGVGLAATVRPVAWTILLAVGAVGAVRAALLATREDGVEGLAARAGEVRTSIAVLGLASLTSAGIAGALLLAFAHGLVAALMFVLAAAPRGRLVSVLGLAASLGMPGLATFAGAAIVVAAATPRHPGFALAVLAAFAILTGAHARVGARVLGVGVAATPAVPERSGAGVLALAASLGVIVLVLGLLPVPALTSIAFGVLDLVRAAAS